MTRCHDLICEIFAEVIKGVPRVSIHRGNLYLEVQLHAHVKQTQERRLRVRLQRNGNHVEDVL